MKKFSKMKFIKFEKIKKSDFENLKNKKFKNNFFEIKNLKI